MYSLEQPSLTSTVDIRQAHGRRMLTDISPHSLLLDEFCTSCFRRRDANATLESESEATSQFQKPVISNGPRNDTRRRRDIVGTNSTAW